MPVPQLNAQPLKWRFHTASVDCGHCVESGFRTGRETDSFYGMVELGKTPPPKVGVYVKIWLILLGVLLASSFLLDIFDTFTVITPDHTSSLKTCFVIAGVAAFANAILAWRMAAKGQLRGGVSFPNRVLASFGFLFIGFLCVFFAIVPIMNIIEGTIDFPAAKMKNLSRGATDFTSV